MREGERMIRGRKNTQEGTFGFWGESIILREEMTVLLVWGWSSLLEDDTGFSLRNLLEFGGLRQGAPVARSFGLGG
jgi:hypothetical protein